MTNGSPLGRMVVDVDLNTTKLNNSATGLQRQMRMVNSALRANLSGLKDSGSESDKLGTKIDGLTKKQKIQEAIVEETEKNYQELVKTKGAASKEAEAYANTLNREQAKLREVTNELKEMERQQKILDSNWTKLGNSFDTAGRSLQTFGGGLQSIGGNLTKWITAPAIAAATAVGGIVTAFGWGRLVSLDSAQAQLRGLNYETEDIERISSQVQNAIEGTTMTMAEGTSVAAGALAAGVEEGEELEHYIKMVGNAAVGANRPIGDMAQIFHRVQGSGKLMTQELNMIEDSMPGFSSKMADHFGVTQEEFRKMVTDGQVTSEDFLTVMEDHAGGMAEAYSDSWEGMVANTKAYIGIIGENLLRGVFEQSKESIAEFIEFLKSDEVVTWAQNTGEVISDAFTKVVDSVKSGIEWFIKLKDEKKQLIGIVTGLAVAAGPLLTALGTMTIFTGKVFTALSPLLLKIGEAGGLFKFLGGAIAGLANPVGITIGIIAALGAGFVIAYNKSDTFRQGVHNVLDKVKEAWEYIKEFGSGIKALFTGSEENGKKILSAIGVTDDNISRITGLRDNILEVKDRVLELGSSIADRVRPALQGVMDFIGEVGTTLVTMWQDNSANIIPIVTNIGNGITNVFKFILATIEFIMPAVEFVIKMVWENIQGVIRGGLKVIDGLVKVFSGIFTGDFSKMWEGVKNIFSGAIQLVWNGFQLLFYGRIIKGVGSLVKLFTSSIQGLWRNVTGFFTRLFQDATRIVGQLNSRINKIVSGLVKSVIDFFRRMFNNTVDLVGRLGSRAWELFKNMGSRVSKTVGNLFRSVRDFFRNMRTNVTNTTSNLRDAVVRLFNRLRDAVVNSVQNLFRRVRDFFSNMFSSVRNTVSNMRSSVVNLIGRMRDGVVNGVSRMRDRVSQLFDRVKEVASKAFENMVKGAKDLPSKLGNAIKNGASKAVNGIKSLGNSMARQLEKVVNGVIGGLNSITSKIGISATISDISIPRFSRGTTGLVSNGAIAQDTLATVGDKGIGNGSGTRELVQYPNGTAGLYDNDATIFAPKGTIIWNNRQTEEILAKNPQFSKGTVGGSGADNGSAKKEKKKGLWGKFKDVLANTWDYIKNPGKALEAVIDNVAPKFDMLDGFAGTMIKGGFNFFKDKALEWITGIFKENEGGNVDGSSILSKPIYQTFGRYKGNIGFNGGKHYGVDTGHKFDPVMSPTAGKVTRKWWDHGGGNSLQITSDKYIWWFMHLSKILKDVGDAVKVGDKVAVSGSSGNFVVGTGHLHTQVHPKSKGAGNHNAIDPMPLLKGKMATGGFATNGLWHLGEEGYGEWVIPTDPKRRTDAMKLLAHAGKSLQKNNGTLRPNNLPNINSGSEVSELRELISKQQDQLDQNNTMIKLLAQIAEKEYVALYDKKKMAKELEPELTKRNEYNNDRRARFS